MESLFTEQQVSQPTHCLASLHSFFILSLEPKCSKFFLQHDSIEGTALGKNQPKVTIITQLFNRQYTHNLHIVVFRLNIPAIRHRVLHNLRGRIVKEPVVQRYCDQTSRLPALPKWRVSNKKVVSEHSDSEDHQQEAELVRTYIDPSIVSLCVHVQCDNEFSQTYQVPPNGHVVFYREVVFFLEVNCFIFHCELSCY